MRIQTKTSSNGVTKKYLYIKISEILGATKSTRESIKSLNKLKSSNLENAKNQIGETRDSLKQYAKIYSLSLVKNMTRPLMALLTADEYYKKAMAAYQVAKPTVEIIARISGVWKAPGNIGEIALIALGVAQKILMQLAIRAFVKIKDLVMNYEIEVPLSSTKAAQTIAQAVEYIYEEASAIDPTQSGNDDIWGETEEDLEAEYIISEGVVNRDLNKFAFILNTNNNLYIAGSSINKGLFYSEDGKNWVSSNITTGSFFGEKSISGEGLSYCVGTCKNDYSNISDGIYYTVDGKNWFPAANGNNYDVTEIRISDDEGIPKYFNAFTRNDGTILYSNNGRSWEKSTINEEEENKKYSGSLKV